MGRLKLEQHHKVEQADQRGREIQEVAEIKNEEAEISSNAVRSIEGVDDDDRAAVEAAISESSSIAKALAESEIKAPGAEVGESLNETMNESTEYANQEYADASTAGEMTGDYSGVGSGLRGSLEQSGQEFQEIADESDRLNGELQAIFADQAAKLESAFG